MPQTFALLRISQPSLCDLKPWLSSDIVNQRVPCYKSCDHVKNQCWWPTVSKITPELNRENSHDRVEKSMLAARRLKNFAGDTQNMNESKFRLVILKKTGSKLVKTAKYLSYISMKV